MLRRLNWLWPLLAIALLVFSCFLPWMTIDSRGITITGVDTTGTRFGKPGYFHFLWTGLYLFFIFINRVWARRTAMIMAAFNLAWACRNFLLLPACFNGDCPTKRAGLYLLLLSSILMLLVTFVLAPGRYAAIKKEIR